MLQLSIPYFTFKYDIGFLLTKQKIIHLKHWRYSFYTHVFTSIFALVAGLTQFSVYIIRKKKWLHRVMGYIYVSDVLFLAGPSGFIMSLYSNGTLITKTSFVILSSLWILFTALAFMKAFKKDFISHRNWMIRSYALTLSAISLRLYALVFPGVFHLTAHEEYTIIAWLSWTINLIIAEIIIYRKNKTICLI